MKMEMVVVYKADAIPGKFFPELEVLKPAEVGNVFHGTYKLKNARIKEIFSRFNAVGPGGIRMRMARVRVAEEPAGN